MDIAFSVPDGLAERLQECWGDLSKRALEAVVAVAYREEALTLGELREILGQSTRRETERFLKEHGTVGEDELEANVETALEVRS